MRSGNGASYNGFNSQKSDLLMNAVSTPQFVPNQIVCIESGPSWLFGEMVQHVTARHQCWVRPLVLAIALDTPSRVETIGGTGWEWYDLREGSDLLLPERLWREALDMEVLPLMALLYQAEDKPEVGAPRSQVARQQLHGFVRQVCATQPEIFRS
jgi:hypothetical protein